jgi:hypothetical protein
MTVATYAEPKLVKGEKVTIDTTLIDGGTSPVHGIPATVVRKQGRYQVIVRLTYPPQGHAESKAFQTADGSWDPIYYFERGAIASREAFNQRRLASIDPDRTVTLIESKCGNDPVWGPMETETALIAGKPSTVIRQLTGETLHAVIVNDVALMDELISALQEARAVMADPATYLPANI